MNETGESGRRFSGKAFSEWIDFFPNQEKVDSRRLLDILSQTSVLDRHSGFVKYFKEVESRLGTRGARDCKLFHLLANSSLSDDMLSLPLDTPDNDYQRFIENIDEYIDSGYAA